jgi:hypothetical protein
LQKYIFISLPGARGDLGVEHMPSMYEALGSFPSIAKKKKVDCIIAMIFKISYYKKLWLTRLWWLTPVILATWEAEIGRILV